MMVLGHGGPERHAAPFGRWGDKGAQGAVWVIGTWVARIGDKLLAEELPKDRPNARYQTQPGRHR